MNGVRKLQVFISSMCGTTQERQKYNYVRASLKTHLEEKGFAYVYLFEDEGASTKAARNHYLDALRDSDFCIFMIDNKDGVSSGVQEWSAPSLCTNQ